MNGECKNKLFKPFIIALIIIFLGIIGFVYVSKNSFNHTTIDDCRSIKSSSGQDSCGKESDSSCKEMHK